MISLRMEEKLQTIRVLTFNILTADSADWERRREVARSRLRAIQPDIVALQETIPGQGSHQVIDLLGPGYHVVENSTQSTDQVGVVLACRWPFRDVHEVDLAVPPRVPSATALAAEVDLPQPFGSTLIIHHAA